MRIKVNGKEDRLEGDGVRLLDYLVSHGIRPELVACEVNLNVNEKKDYAETLLREGDTVEIAKFVGGGSR